MSSTFGKGCASLVLCSAWARQRTAVTLGEGSCTDRNEQDLQQGTGITGTASDKATSNSTLVSNDLKRTRSHLAQTPLENRSTSLPKETYFKHK